MDYELKSDYEMIVGDDWNPKLGHPYYLVWRAGGEEIYSDGNNRRQKFKDDGSIYKFIVVGLVSGYPKFLLHSEDGAALELADGYLEYRICGELHRKDGPAVIFSDGREEFWVHGKQVAQSG